MLVNMIALVVFVASLSAGQLLFKTSASHLTAGAVPYALLLDPVFYLALAIYGAATVLWIWILTRMPLSLAYPWVASTMVIVPLLAAFLFGETLNLRFWLGSALVMAGIVTINLGGVT